MNTTEMLDEPPREAGPAGREHVAARGLRKGGCRRRWGTPGDDGSATAFAPPAPYSESPSIPEGVWYGNADLWTVPETDGAYQPRKSVWWSAAFVGGDAEPMPEFKVTHQRPDEEGVPPIVESPGTNAYPVKDGWFMIAGIDPQTAGCWRVTAEYRGASLSYVCQTGQ